MKDPRLQTLSRQLIRYSCELKKGERVLIEAFGSMPEFVSMLVEETYAVGAEPIVVIRDSRIQRALLMGGTAEKWDAEAKLDSDRMKSVQAYIGVRATDNSYESSDVPASQTQLYSKHYSQKVHGEIRVPQTRWVVLRYPTHSMAQLAETSLEAFEDFYFNVCTLDYAKMSKAMDHLVERMQRADRVHITGRNTDLTFSIKGLPPIKCDGKLNVPDGEVFSAPVRESVNGTLTYNTPSIYQGNVYENISLTFENGKIVKATANNTEAINRIFDTDPGARYVGEFSFGVNPYITKAMKDTLFDEKISGSIHFTPGHCYDECDNGNRSAIHWDLVYIQTPAYGGGEIWFDDELIRKDGLFVPEYLRCLNPDELK